MSETPDSTEIGALREAEEGADNVLWSVGPGGSEILVRNADILLAHLPLFLTGWPLARTSAENGETAAIEVGRQADGRIRIADRGAGAAERIFEDEFSAARGLCEALVADLVARQADRVCVSAGSAMVGRGLAVLLGNSLAGKSSVALHLAAAGYRLFGEDRLAVGLGQDKAPVGQCLGLAPKIGLPLPDDCGPRFAEYVEAFTEIHDAGTAYLKLWDGEAAVFLEQAPVTAFVILDRTETGPCTLSAASPSDITRALLPACFAPHRDEKPVRAAMAQLAANAGGYKLTFSSSHEAAAALARAVRDQETGSN